MRVRALRALAFAGARSIPVACALLLLPCAHAQQWREEFAAGVLDPARWHGTMSGDLHAPVVRIVPAEDGSGSRLRLAADTRGTRDDSIKRVGVGTRCRLALGREARIGVDLDWGPPANGSYLSAALVLSPHYTDGDPAATADWLSVGYVGVPPGRTARLLVRASASGVARTLYDDGWPDRNRHGRTVTRVSLELSLRGRSLELRENGRPIPVPLPAPGRLASGYLYLQLSSHSNFPPRAVHFDDLWVTRGNGAGPVLAFPRAPACGNDLPRPPG